MVESRPVQKDPRYFSRLFKEDIKSSIFLLITFVVSRLVGLQPASKYGPTLEMAAKCLHGVEEYNRKAQPQCSCASI